MNNKNIALLLSACMLSLGATATHAQNAIKFPDYYVEGKFQIAAARMISGICPRIDLNTSKVEKFEASLSARMVKDEVLPADVSEDDQSVKFALVTGTSFGGSLISLFKKYSIDPNGRGDVKQPEVYEKFCKMGQGEIDTGTDVGKFISLPE